MGLKQHATVPFYVPPVPANKMKIFFSYIVLRLTDMYIRGLILELSRSFPISGSYLLHV